MESNPNFYEPKLPPVSTMGTGRFDLEFKFPTTISDPSANQNDIVFCGKVMIRQTEPGPAKGRRKNPLLARSESFSGRSNRYFSGREQRSGSLRLPATGDSRLRRRSSSCRRHFNGLFGMVKFPVQMELSDMKKRQQRREPVPAKFPAAGDRKSCWEWLRRRLVVFRWFYTRDEL